MAPAFVAERLDPVVSPALDQVILAAQIRFRAAPHEQRIVGRPANFIDAHLDQRFGNAD